MKVERTLVPNSGFRLLAAPDMAPLTFLLQALQAILLSGPCIMTSQDAFCLSCMCLT